MVMGKGKKVPPTIYIQIASYRDPELLNTLHDCIRTAERPDQLRFGIGWQYSPYESWDNLDPYINDSRFRIIALDYRDAKGPCWIRHQLNEKYSGETYTLQLDSHHRFTQNWDTTLITMLESLRTPKCKKPLLSSYLPSFEPSNDPASRLEAPWVMEFDRFAPEGPVHFLPHTIDDWAERTSPIPTRFVSGHFIFTTGKFCQEVKYDPTYYFHGEEINLSVRAYMAGYDLYAPHRVVMWHEYTREGKKKHWDDHTNWPELDKQSYAHNRELLGIDNATSSKLLKKRTRTLKEYEQYAGLEFSTRRAHKFTIEKKLPPISLDEISHTSGLVNYHKMCIDVYKPIFTEIDYNFWAVAFEDKHGNEIYRQDATKEEIIQLLSIPVEVDKFVHVWRNFYADEQPTKWIIWPQSENKGWMERLTGEFQK
jgi:GT2 family glycosyltransferase